MHRAGVECADDSSQPEALAITVLDEHGGGRSYVTQLRQAGRDVSRTAKFTQAWSDCKDTIRMLHKI